MSRKGSTKVPAKGDGWKGFVDVPLPEGIEWDAIAAATPPGAGYPVLQDLVGLGYKVSVSYSVANDGYVCSVTGGASCGDNAGYTLTGWSSKLERAVSAAWYKVVIVCDGKSWHQWKQLGIFDI